MRVARLGVQLTHRVNLRPRVAACRSWNVRLCSETTLGMDFAEYGADQDGGPLAASSERECAMAKAGRRHGRQQGRG